MGKSLPRTRLANNLSNGLILIQSPRFLRSDLADPGIELGKAVERIVQLVPAYLFPDPFHDYNVVASLLDSCKRASCFTARPTALGVTL